MLIGIFLFLKQIVDVIYELKVLDVLMVVFALALIGVQSVRLLKDSGVNQSVQNVFALVKNQIKPIDYAVLILACLYALSFLRDMHAMASFVKIESAFLIYVLGRVYGQKIIDKGRCLAIASYLIVYANMIYIAAERWCDKYRCHMFPWDKFGMFNGGAMYYYKTDLAIGMILASLFIYSYSKSKVFKWITLYVAVPYTIYDANARLGKAILACVLLSFLIREIVLRIKHRNVGKIMTADDDAKVSGKARKIGFLEIIFGITAVFIVALFIAIQVTPVKQFKYYDLGLSSDLMNRLENLCHSRHIIWWDTFHSMANQGFFTRCIGIDLQNFPEYNDPHMMSHCLYLNMFFAIGYIGIFAFIAFLYLIFKNIGKLRDSNTRFVTVTLWLVILIFGISMDPIEYTQISWFPFMYAGLIVNMISSNVNNRE